MPQPAASADDDDVLGLYPLRDFRLTTGARAGAALQRQAAWYFRDERIAVPAATVPQASFARGMRVDADLRAWAKLPPTASTYPPLVWLAAPDIVRNARCAIDDTTITTATGSLPLRLAPKIAMNRSWFDATSAAFFAVRPCRLHGARDGDAFVARTFWPEDFRLGPQPPALTALSVPDQPAASLRHWMRDSPYGGARAPFAAQTLWRRNGSGDWRRRAVLALVINGAQGDDDEAHGGHFAIATGRIADDGDIGHWLVNNFYSLDVESEKGILPAPVRLADYQGDVNSGQSWYRPSYAIVAVLDDARAALRVQDALHRVYLQFFRHQLAYYHPTANCTSISVDTLRALGLHVPACGATHGVLPWLGLPFIALHERSLARAKLAFDYLTVERTRLMPALAAEAAFASLWALAHGDLAHQGDLGRTLARDLAALAWLRIPQFPSSRAWGNAPALSIAEYRARAPRDPAQAQIIPLPPRAFPDALRDDDLLPPRQPSDTAVAAWGAASLVALPWLAWRRWRRRD